jgi:outer membrane protein TolC
MRLLPYFLAALAAATSAPLAAQIWTADAPRSPQLQELVAEAVSNSPEIRAAGNERLAAQHRVSPAGALDDPMLEAGVLNAPLKTSDTFRREDMTMKMLGLSQKFPFPGKRDLRQDVAAKDAEAVAYAYQETVNRVIRDVKVSYFELAYVAESARLVEKNRQVLDQFLKISESRYSVGQGNQSDVLKAQTQLSKMADELIKLARERRAIEAELIRALGRGSGRVHRASGLRLQEAPLSWNHCWNRRARIVRNFWTEKPGRSRRQGAGSRAPGLLPGFRRQVFVRPTGQDAGRNAAGTIW